MSNDSKGPVEAEIERRLKAALTPETLVVQNDSAQHAGHMGDDGSGESHFTVHVVSADFAGQSRVARQRMVNHVLGDLLSSGTVHALAIKAKAPGE